MRTGRWAAAATLAGALLVAEDARAGDVSFFIDASTGPGAAVFHYFGLGGDYAGFSFHIQTCMGARFAKRWGAGGGGGFQPLIGSSGFFGGGFVGACAEVEPIERLHIDATVGFGGVGGTGAATVGPALSIGGSYDLVGDQKARMFLGLRVLAFPGWSNGRNGFYISPTFSIGFRWW